MDKEKCKYRYKNEWGPTFNCDHPKNELGSCSKAFCPLIDDVFNKDLIKMEKKDAVEVMKQITDMINTMKDLEENTQDAEMAKYFMGFKDALDWVQTDVLRKDRIKHHLVFKIEAY